MRNFLKQLAIFAGIQLAILAAIYSRLPAPVETYGGVVADKHRRAETAPGHRLLLAGGSNLAFGIDSDAIEKATGLHPVNLAISAELGAEYVLNEARAYARPGDVVLVSLEYEQFVEDTTNFNAIYTILAEPTTAQYFGWQQFKIILDQGFVYLNKTVHAAKHPENFLKKTKLRRIHFNEFGDLVGHHQLPSRYDGSDLRGSFEMNEERLNYVVKRMRAFADSCRERDIQVFYLPPVIANDAYARMKAGDLDLVLSTINNDIGMPLLHATSKTVFPADRFYDTRYHLMLPGKRERTQVVIDSLRPHARIALGTSTTKQL